LPNLKNYNGALTREQFLFDEIRIIAKLMAQGLVDEQISQAVVQDNLFQFPTERMIVRFVHTCLRRLHALHSTYLVSQLATAPLEDAKQINLYAIMKDNRLMWDFMTTVIGEKYRLQDMTLSRKDLNLFFMRLQEQDNTVAGWKDSTVQKIKSVMIRMLIETGYTTDISSGILQPVLICQELEEGIRENLDHEALAAFNCFR